MPTFISSEDFTQHVKNTILRYGDKLQSFHLETEGLHFDPIKWMFDRAVYGLSWSEIVGAELFALREQKYPAEMHYFHKELFAYLPHCNVLHADWDVILEKPDGISFGNQVISRVYVKIIDRYDDLPPRKKDALFIHMQGQLLQERDCACLLVETLSVSSHNQPWELETGLVHDTIRRVSLDQFYALVTGQEDAFYKMCMALPAVIEKAVEELGADAVPNDTVFEELLKEQTGIEENLLTACHPTYLGFENEKEE